MNMFLNLHAIMAMTLFELFGILGQILGGIIIYVCCINYALKGLKILFSHGIISGFLNRLCYLCYGIIITPVLVVSLVIISVTYPFCMLYEKVIMPGIKIFWTYVDICIEYTSIIPELLMTCGVFVISRLSDIKSRKNIHHIVSDKFDDINHPPKKSFRYVCFSNAM